MSIKANKLLRNRNFLIEKLEIMNVGMPSFNKPESITPTIKGCISL